MKIHSWKNLSSLLFSVFLNLFFLSLTSSQAKAMKLDWKGKYLGEYISVDRPSLGDPKLQKSYLTNHLTLSPKIIATDGVNLVSSFEIFGNASYPDSHVGQIFGSGVGRSGGPQSASSGLTSHNQASSTIEVSQLYLNINHEYGSLLFGRAPVNFGLGMTYSAGLGEFDHWYDVHDLLGYKFIIGNLSIMPMIGKVFHRSPKLGDEATDVIWDIEYYNPETESTFGIFHLTRSASFGLANDAPIALLSPGGSLTSGWSSQHVNVLFGRGFDSFNFKIEAGFQSGSTGVASSPAQEEIKLGGYGIALEFLWPRKEGHWEWSLKTGVASGDNPNTTGTYEGFHFNRNYDVAFLLFNHPMGGYDMFRTKLQRPCLSTPCTGVSPSLASNDEAIDEEAISNVIFIAPRLTIDLNDRWEYSGTLIAAQLQTNPSILTPQPDVQKDVGFEFDLSLTYKMTEKIKWVNEVGLLVPGSAWKEGGSRANDFTYGFQSKAAISF